MDQSVQRLLTDKLYDKRKQGALELERLVREAIANKEYEKIRKIVEQLCHDYAYAVHQPHARNGGLIGLAAAAIALGTEEVARYLQEIVPPVLACFTDQDARVRYYACESMYNIAKVAKGEILAFFNEIFDALCKLAADSELSVKNGAELLDRLVKDIVAESAASYVSILHYSEKRAGEGGQQLDEDTSSMDLPTAFSLAKFIPLLQERIHVINPFTRTFLVSWLTLLDTIPDLELIYYLPAFLGGLFKFLGDPNRDVYVATQGLLERFLSEVKKIAKIKRGIAESRRSHHHGHRKRSSGSQTESEPTGDDGSNENAIQDSDSGTANDQRYGDHDGDWIPGQDVQVDHTKILDTLLMFVDVSSNKESAQALKLEGLTKQKEEEIGIVALRWIDSFFEISPEDILQFVPRLLAQVLPALSAQSDQVRTTASRVNRSLMDYIVTFEDEASPEERSSIPHSNIPIPSTKVGESQDRRGSVTNPKVATEGAAESRTSPDLTPRSSAAPTPQPISDLDYAAAVNALTLQFLNEHEATRVAALGWLIMLHRKAPRKILAFNDGTFPALLKTLSDPSEAVVTRDLQLLSQISRNSEDGYFTSFMVNLLQLFSTDRKLLEIRGSLIIRQLCINLMPERIYRTLADCLEKDEDIEFASIMVQNLNNNLITAPELADLRKRLRNLETKDGQTFFVALFRSWCHNAVATFSLCLLAQAYEQAYNLLQIFAELEMTVNMLIQIDKLVQLLESPVFTYLRLQLLEPERYPYLSKCLYGLLMLLPQSSAFAALKNRLNSVSAIGLIHPPMFNTPSAARPSYVNPSSASSSTSSLVPNASSPSNPHHTRQRSSEKPVALPLVGALTSSSASSVVAGMGAASGIPGGVVSAAGRLGKAREGTGAAAGQASEIRWGELLEKFRATQERARRRNQIILHGDDSDMPWTRGMLDTSDLAGDGALRSFARDGGGDRGERSMLLTDISGRGGGGGGGGGGASFGLLQVGGTGIPRPTSAQSGSLNSSAARGGAMATSGAAQSLGGHHKKSSLSNLGRLASGIGGGGRSRDKTKK